MEQNNSATGRQETGLVGFGGIQNGGRYDDQGLAVVAAGAGAGSVAASAAGAACGTGSGAAGVSISGAGGVAVGGGVSVAVDAGAAGGGGASGSGVAGPSFQSARGMKRGNYRHKQSLINDMEAYFKDNQHPDESQRNYLARRLGMDPAQVKYWFQNKRTKLKSQREREEIEALRSKNDVLRARRQQLIEALRLENKRIREETELLQSTLARFIAGEDLQNLPITFLDPQNPSTSQNPQN